VTRPTGRVSRRAAYGPPSVGRWSSLDGLAAAAPDEHHDHACGHGSAVLDAVRAVGGVERRRSFAQRCAVPVVEDESDLALDDVEQLAAALGMNLAFVDVAGLERPVPELGLGRVLGADEEGSPAALGATPDAHCLVARDDAELRLVADLDQLRNADAERRRQ